MAQENRTFGQSLLDELKSRGGLSIITSRMDFAQIQDFKKMNREEAIKIFEGSDYATLQILKTESPAEISTCLIQNAEKAVNGFTTSLFILGFAVN